jgi:hypothetical protein
MLLQKNGRERDGKGERERDRERERGMGRGREKETERERERERFLGGTEIESPAAGPGASKTVIYESRGTTN